jgi:hypothetical protein
MRPVVLVRPPAVERAGEVWKMLGQNAVIVCADYEQATQWADAAPPELRAHAVTGLSRTTTLLKEGRAKVVTGAPADLAALVARSALKLGSCETIVLAWPESFATELDTLLTEAPDARRLVLSWNPPALADFLERHARRAEISGNLPLDIEGQPLGPIAAARYAVVSSTRRAAAVRDALDALRSVRPYVWSGGPIDPKAEHPDAVVAVTLPTRDELRALAAIGPTVVLVLPSQLAYLRSIATLTPLSLPSAADRAQDRVAAMRTQIAERISRGALDPELAILAPVFEEHDPALVAAALLAISHRPSAVSESPVTSTEPGWVRVFVNVGRKDGAAAKDLVGALIKEAGLQKGQIGRIDARESFSLVEVAPQVAEQAIRRLAGVSIRGRRVAARLDRG